MTGECHFLVKMGFSSRGFWLLLFCGRIAFFFSFSSSFLIAVLPFLPVNKLCPFPPFFLYLLECLFCLNWEPTRGGECFLCQGFCGYVGHQLWIAQSRQLDGEWPRQAHLSPLSCPSATPLNSLALAQGLDISNPSSRCWLRVICRGFKCFSSRFRYSVCIK